MFGVRKRSDKVGFSKEQVKVEMPVLRECFLLAEKRCPGEKQKETSRKLDYKLSIAFIGREKEKHPPHNINSPLQKHLA